MAYFGAREAKIAKSCKNQAELSSYVTSLLNGIDNSKHAEAISEIERKLGLFTGKIRTAGFFSKRISLADAMQNAITEYKATIGSDEVREDIRELNAHSLEALTEPANDPGRQNRLDQILTTGFYNKRPDTRRITPSVMKRAAQAVGSLAATVALGLGLNYSNASVEPIPAHVEEAPVMAYTVQEQETQTQTLVSQSYAHPIFEEAQEQNETYTTTDIPTVADKDSTSQQRDQMMDWLVEDYFEGVSDGIITPVDRTPFFTGGGSLNRFAYAVAKVDSQGSVRIHRRGDFEPRSAYSIIPNNHGPTSQELRDTHRTVERLRAEEDARRVIRQIETLTRSRPLTPRSTTRRDPRATRVQEERIVDYSEDLAALELDPLYHLF